MKKFMILALLFVGCETCTSPDLTPEKPDPCSVKYKYVVSDPPYEIELWNGEVWYLTEGEYDTLQVGTVVKTCHQHERGLD